MKWKRVNRSSKVAFTTNVKKAGLLCGYFKPTSRKQERIKVEVVFLSLNPNLWWPRRGRKGWITWSHIIVPTCLIESHCKIKALAWKISTAFMNFRSVRNFWTWDKGVLTPATESATFYNRLAKSNVWGCVGRPRFVLPSCNLAPLVLNHSMPSCNLAQVKVQVLSKSYLETLYFPTAIQERGIYLGNLWFSSLIKVILGRIFLTTFSGAAQFAIIAAAILGLS